MVSPRLPTARLTPRYDLQTERRAGREAWQKWYAIRQDVPEQEGTDHVYPMNQQTPDDDLGFG